MITLVSNRLVACFIASILFVSAQMSVSAQSVGGERSPYPSDGVLLGTGWNSFKQEKTLSNCVRVGTKQDTSEVRPAVQFKEVRDSNALMNFFSISVKAKAKSILGGSASARASFAKTVTIKKESLNYAVDASIDHGVEYVIPLNSNQIVLYPEFVRLARTNPIKFRKQCGDGFVSAIYRNTGILGVYSFTTGSLEEKERIKAQISGSGGGFSVSVAAENVTEQSNSQTKLAISYSQLGGAGTPFAIDNKGFRALIAQLGTSAQGAAATEIGIRSYRDLPNFPTAVSPASLAVDKMANQYFRLLDLYRSLRDEDANRLPREWWQMPSPNTPGWELAFALIHPNKLEDKLLIDMQAIRAALQHCAQDMNGCRAPASMKSDDYHYIAQMPTLEDMERGFMYQRRFDIEEAMKEYYAAKEAYRIAPSDCELMKKANKKILAAFWAYSKDLELQRFLDLQDIAKQRCDEEDPLCLTNAQLEVWRRKIMVSAGKSAPTDIYGCKVDAWNAWRND
ncbi:MAG: hypothetical protein ACR2MD_17595 [Aridibacter sp.]